MIDADFYVLSDTAADTNVRFDPQCRHSYRRMQSLLSKGQFQGVTV